MNKVYSTYKQFLYDKFILTKEHSVKAVARKSGICKSTLYNYIENATTPPADIVSPLYNATGDTDFLNYIIDDTDKILAPRQKPDGNKTLLEETLDVAAECGAFVNMMQKYTHEKSKAGKEIDRDEAHQINNAINRAEKELEDVRQRINKT